MRRRTITVDGRVYMIRGPHTVADLKRMYKSAVAKYPSLTFMEFLRRGFVYVRVA